MCLSAPACRRATADTCSAQAGLSAGDAQAGQSLKGSAAPSLPAMKRNIFSEGGQRFQWFSPECAILPAFRVPSAGAGCPWRFENFGFRYTHPTFVDSPQSSTLTTTWLSKRCQAERQRYAWFREADWVGNGTLACRVSRASANSGCPLKMTRTTPFCCRWYDPAHFPVPSR